MPGPRTRRNDRGRCSYVTQRQPAGDVAVYHRVSNECGEALRSTLRPRFRSTRDLFWGLWTPRCQDYVKNSEPETCAGLVRLMECWRVESKDRALS